ncbi:MAG: hypothetical protein JOY69_06735 [Candidatus Eremiobacteraeota bacterium]|nr:hypothetical protein [Candidatus Eremiobacteraeota bacterium]
MSDSFRTTPPNQQWSGANPAANGYQGGAPGPGHERSNDVEAGEIGKALVVGLLGGLLSAAGYMVYRRLPDEQKERLHAQVRNVVAQRVTELRQNFNI